MSSDVESLLFNSTLAFVAGALLNFTPCVLPVIPIKMHTLLDEVGRGLGQRLLAALAFFLGGMAFFLALGGATAYLGLFWGALFQSRGFLIALCLFLVVSAVATLADWTFGLPQVFYRIPGRRYLGAFFTGAVAGILSTPCAGPFLGSVLAYALTRSPPVILTVFGAIGAGLVAPYIVVLAWPGLLNRLSVLRPWARQVKQLLAMVLLAGAVFFSEALLPDGLVRLLWAGLGLGVVAWAGRQVFHADSRAGRVLPVLATGLVVVLVTRVEPRPSALTWQSYSAPALEAILAEPEGPVVLDFTAEWCLNCRVIESTVFVDEDVLRAVREEGAVLMRVDLTALEPERQRLLQSMGGTALPFFVILDREGRVARRFTDIFTAHEFIEALRGCCRAGAP